MNVDEKKNDCEIRNELQDQMIRETAEFVELHKLFEHALEEINTKLEIASDEFQLRFHRNPIQRVESRIKSLSSILNKLYRKDLTLSAEKAKEQLTDIAGIRVICNYIDDIYVIADLLCSQDNLFLIRKTDYIKNPKDNGYRSLHLIVRVSVSTAGKTEFVPVEIQIRSIAMDFWASLEHQIYYKRGCDNTPEALIKRLKECADTIAKTDIEMQEINQELQDICKKKIRE